MRHIRWCAAQLATRDACQALNMHMRMNGEHKFLYDADHLTAARRECGFEVRQTRFNQSRIPELRYLDLRDFGLNLFFEATKASGPRVV